MIYLRLFLSFLKIGLLGFGGGYAFLPLIQEEAVSQEYVTSQEFANLLAIAEMTPGPMALNTATFVGAKTAGFWGSLMATIGVTLPSLVLSVLAVWLLQKPAAKLVRDGLAALKPTIVALILFAALTIFLVDWPGPKGYHSIWTVILFSSSIGAYFWLKAHPVLIVGIAGMAGAILYYAGVTL